MRQRHRQIGSLTNAPLLMLGSLAVLAALVALLVWNPTKRRAQTGDVGDPLHVYVAAGIREPVEAIGKAFEEELGIGLRIDAKSSGALLSTLETAVKGDVFIPADEQFIQLALAKGLIIEHIPFGRFRLVLAVAKSNPKKIATLDDLFRPGVTYALPNNETASGKAAKKALDKSGEWDKLWKGKKVEQPTVTEVALLVQTGSVDAGVIWDSTARQFDLESVALSQFKDSVSTISAAVVSGSRRPTDALRFARFLAAPEKGQAIMNQLFYETLPGDPWAVEPKITLFAGGLNGAGCRQTVDEFRLREGVKLVEEYQGCGTLVSQMKAGARPDAYFACDVSFSRDVADLFREFRNVSQTRMVILVPRGNPMNIRTLKDLAKEGVKVGRADEEKSALGALTKKLLQSEGVYAAVAANTKATAPTADLLVAQLVESGSLHAAVVYEANCHHVKDRAQVIAIDHPDAIAVQPIAVGKGTKYPQLMGRLIEAITAAQSKQRFETVGFKWMWVPQNAKP